MLIVLDTTETFADLRMEGANYTFLRELCLTESGETRGSPDRYRGDHQSLRGIAGTVSGCSTSRNSVREEVGS